MFSLNSLVQKAQSLIDTTSPPTNESDTNPSKAALFRLQFRLPDSQTPTNEITAELSLSIPHASRSATQSLDHKQKALDGGNNYVGKLHMSESFLCFSTQPTSFQSSASLQASSGFTGQTHGAGPAGNGFTLPLCAIRRVERLYTENGLYALAITTWNGFTVSPNQHRNPTEIQRFKIQLAGSRQACEKFCDSLKRGLRDAVKEIENLKAIVGGCYSEYLLSGNNKGERDEAKALNEVREPPDAGLGMVFRYPGDPKKLRDRSKMRLWGEYLRGQPSTVSSNMPANEWQRMAEMLLSSGNLLFISLSELGCRIASEARSGSSRQARSSCDYRSPSYLQTLLRDSQVVNHWRSTRLKKILIEVYPSILGFKVRKALGD